MRHASQEDIDKWVASRKKEEEVMHRAREMAIALKLDMKISDVEYQGDGSKATFYYTANARVDFRQLIKDMADQFRVRIEMRQIGARQESARLGGIGSCGRELCCSTWLTDFRSVSTSAARYQQLSLNPQKLAGQCGKLKCCLNYELDMYIDELKDFPSTDIKLYTKKGSGIHIKTDVFKRLMWYLYQTDDKSGPNLVALSPERVKEIISLNKEKKNPEDLKDFEETVYESEVPDYTNVVGQDDLNRFDKKFKKKKKRKSNKRKSSGNKPSGKGGKQTQAKSNGDKGGKDKKGKSDNKSNKNPQAKKKTQQKGSHKQKPNDSQKGKVGQKSGNRNRPKPSNNPTKSKSGNKPSNSSPKNKRSKSDGNQKGKNEE
ncbi:PSP1 domain-containing protein [Brumimicrobium salinarum]|uniref:PSP1 domain-containing protein n=1 Tax=Brumimicrobium salinarum TaxID=2058658 RepID=UPI0021CD8002|nr:regulatory iron-sulfur-containing complex subunit RicT [Brumimicrobium salinarum]